MVLGRGRGRSRAGAGAGASKQAALTGVSYLVPSLLSVAGCAALLFTGFVYIVLDLVAAPMPATGHHTVPCTLAYSAVSGGGEGVVRGGGEAEAEEEGGGDGVMGALPEILMSAQL